MPALRVLLADDHEIIRGGLRMILQKLPDVEVVGEAADGRSAADMARQFRPDIVIMDISMPGLNGIEATRQIVAEGSGAKVVVLSMHSDRQFVTEALKAGATGYLLKNSAMSEVGTAVRVVARGQVYLSPRVAEVVVDNYLRREMSPEEAASAFKVLSPREREVLQLLAEGRTSKEIAERLYLSSKTIETHRSQIMDKLNIRTVAELTKYAVREGLTPLD